MGRFPIKAKKFILLILSIVLIATISLFVIQEVKEEPGERIIHSFMKAKGIHILPCTEEYGRFMKGILLGEYPELTEESSKYIHNQDELSQVLKYAGTHMNPCFMDIFKKKYQEPDVEEAKPPITEPDN